MEHYHYSVYFKQFWPFLVHFSSTLHSLILPSVYPAKNTPTAGFSSRSTQISRWTLNHGCAPWGGQELSLVSIPRFSLHRLMQQGATKHTQPCKHTQLTQLSLTSLWQQLMWYNSPLAYGPNLLCLNILSRSYCTIAIPWRLFMQHYTTATKLYTPTLC